ncbi:hypothetical protein [Rhodopila globiformis]|uniref:DUF5681 domain-containing protein n=1 Tax=Rhodopila globiformis TaxID=1071 RepID=A0A2S6N5Z3_RHOGL|nr:hypothetical protein [Rhodopila globiformis]PPQ30034.1 hypothetical protein CCS01_20255 [Rhodopila globiformis]
MVDRATKRGRGRTTVKLGSGAKPPQKLGRGRQPKYDEPMTRADRQSPYVRARQRDQAEVAYALRDTLWRSKATQAAVVAAYRDTPSGERLRRGLARLLNSKATDDPAEQETMKATRAFFDGLMSSDDRK